MTTQEGLDRVKVFSELTGESINIRPIVDKWILVTYDLPSTEEGAQIRSDFLRTAKRIGAVQHTESVYLLPWTQEAEMLAFDISRAGKAFIWTSEIRDPAQSEQVTASYDTHLKVRLRELEGRLLKIAEHIEADHMKRASAMAEKTQELLTALETAILARGSAALYKEFLELHAWLKKVTP